jgi:hypothetical protein
MEDDLKQTILKARQGAVAKTGNDWENYVVNFLKESFSEIERENKNLRITVSDIDVRKMGKRNEINRIRKDVPKLYETLFIPIINFAKEREYLLNNLDIIDALFESSEVGDTDIVVFSKTYHVPILVVSCKASLHGRLTETLFYSLYYRITNKIKFVLATLDKGKQAKDKWETEWGTPENPSKDRNLSTMFLDGVYVDNVPNLMPQGFNAEKEKTFLGGIVRDLSELPLDIIRWYGDIKFSVKKNTNDVPTLL